MPKMGTEMGVEAKQQMTPPSEKDRMWPHIWLGRIFAHINLAGRKFFGCAAAEPPTPSKHKIKAKVIKHLLAGDCAQL
jgi:hypothetical protein